MKAIATGYFEVSIQPAVESEAEAGVEIGRYTLDKQFFGDLIGQSRGEMLTATTGTEGSAGYVALERVSGSLHGREGSFVFQHAGLMDRGEQQLSITVVPDSGAGQLAGISGEFRLQIVDGKHFYEFEYSLPD